MQTPIQKHTRDHMLQLCGAIDYAVKQIDQGLNEYSQATIREVLIEARHTLYQATKSVEVSKLDILC